MRFFGLFLLAATVSACSVRGAVSQIAPIAHIEAPATSSCCGPTMLTVWYYGTKHPVSRSVAPFFRHASQSNEFDVGIDTWERVDYPLGMLVGFPSEPERAFFSVAATFSPESTGTIYVRVHPKEPDFRIPWDPQVLRQFQAASGLATNSLDASIDVR